jgi:FtsH-binding integral membrane protein
MRHLHHKEYFTKLIRKQTDPISGYFWMFAPIKLGKYLNRSPINPTRMTFLTGFVGTNGFILSQTLLSQDKYFYPRTKWFVPG